MAKQWIDENGIEIPANRIKNSEKLKEKWSKKIRDKAEKLNKELAEVKAMMIQAANEIAIEVYSESGVDIEKTKGNFTWYDFNRITRHECNINERIEFDGLLIAAAKVKLDEYVEGQQLGTNTLVRSLIQDAFTTVKGKLDTKKVLSLLSYKTRYKKEEHLLFFEGLELIEQSVRRPSSKAYHRVSVKSTQGEYKNIELNLSNI